jgi:hypothetical protein
MSKRKIALLVIIGVVGIILNGLWLQKSGKMPLNWADFLGMVNMPTSEREAVKTAFSAEETAIVEWVDEIAKYENCGSGIIDTNGRKSFGDLCFQETTFRTYVKKYNLLPQCEEAEIMNWITDGDFQRELAYRMIDEDIENWRHWYTTVAIKKVGLPQM